MRNAFFCTAFAAMLLGGAASARDIPSGGVTFADVSSWLQGKGYTTEFVNESPQHVRLVIGGIRYGFYLFDCHGGDRCGTLQFSVGWATHGKFDTSQMNRWNRDKRWCRGYFDASNEPWVEMDVDLTPTATYELLDDEFATYQGCVSGFSEMYPIVK